MLKSRCVKRAEWSKEDADSSSLPSVRRDHGGRRDKGTGILTEKKKRVFPQYFVSSHTHTYILRKVTRGEKRKRKNVPGQEQAISRILCGSKQYISIKRSVAHVVRGSQYLFQPLIPCLSKLQRLESKAHSSQLPLQLEVAIRQSPGQ